MRRRSALDVKSFYYSVKDKLDELFVMYPRKKCWKISFLLPNGKVNYDKDDYYVAGVLVDGDAGFALLTDFQL